MPPLLGDELPIGGLAPEAIDVEDVLTDAGDGYLQKALAFGGLEEDPLLLRQAMPDPAIADLPAGRLPATESLDVILIRLRHTEQAKGEGWKRKWAGQKRVPDRIALKTCRGLIPKTFPVGECELAEPQGAVFWESSGILPVLCPATPCKPLPS